MNELESLREAVHSLATDLGAQGTKRFVHDKVDDVFIRAVKFAEQVVEAWVAELVEGGLAELEARVLQLEQETRSRAQRRMMDEFIAKVDAVMGFEGAVREEAKDE